MVKIDILIKEGKISKINELEMERYINFFEKSHKNNLEHCNFVIKAFPRWSIISGYYAMHDITKLLLAKEFRIKIEIEVHATTIKVLRELIKNKDILLLMEKGYSEFLFLTNDLAKAKKDRVKAQYYTGTEYMRKDYEKRAEEFMKDVVSPFISKIKKLAEKND